MIPVSIFSAKSASMMDINIIILLSVVLIAAAIFDLVVHKIPNLLTYPAMTAALIYYLIVMGWEGLLFSVKGLALGIILFIIPYLMGAMGAGDTKLMGAVGAILGAKGVFMTSVCTAIIGGFYAVFLLIFQPQYRKGIFRRPVTAFKSIILTGQYIAIPDAEAGRQPKLYYGIAIALGTLAYILLNYSGGSLIPE